MSKNTFKLNLLLKLAAYRTITKTNSQENWQLFLLSNQNGNNNETNFEIRTTNRLHRLNIEKYLQYVYDISILKHLN